MLIAQSLENKGFILSTQPFAIRLISSRENEN
ncbi:hypothetical protein Nos7107_2039 [Nostoc sp. PCC 7107]|nr:hypothetical protein Nos7107_2039 [Nostoc sp. PCC 7107]